MAGAGAVVTRDVPPDAIVTGNPARITGYAGVTSPVAADSGKAGGETGSWPTSVRGVIVHRIPHVEDLRGHLVFLEAMRQVPFEIKRYFLVFGVSSQEIRGEHAHRTLHQFLSCVHGCCHVVADDGFVREEFVLDHPSLGLYLPPMTWAVQYKYSPDAVLLVATSEYYRPEDYIRSYSEFRELSACPPMILFNDFKRQWRDTGADTLAAVNAVGESGWYILGDEARAFENALATCWEITHAVGVASGLDALELSLRALGCRFGDKVLTTSISAFATTLAIVKLGAVPVYVDCDRFGLIDLDVCEEYLKVHPEVHFFVPVHLYGAQSRPESPGGPSR